MTLFQLFALFYFANCTASENKSDLWKRFGAHLFHQIVKWWHPHVLLLISISFPSFKMHHAALSASVAAHRGHGLSFSSEPANFSRPRTHTERCTTDLSTESHAVSWTWTNERCIHLWHDSRDAPNRRTAAAQLKCHKMAN